MFNWTFDLHMLVYAGEILFIVAVVVVLIVLISIRSILEGWRKKRGKEK